MKSLVEELAKALVDHPEDVRVSEDKEDDKIVYQIKVNEEDMGQIIGKGGKIANSIRTVVKAAGTKKSLRVYIEIVS